MIFPFNPINFYLVVRQVPAISFGYKRAVYNRMTNIVLDICAGFVDLVFPRQCVGCDRIDINGLCSECRKSLYWLDPARVCVRCSEPLNVAGESFPLVCSRCRRNPPACKKVSAALEYDGVVSRAIVLWKYRSEQYLSTLFSDLLEEWVTRYDPEWIRMIDVIVPVPHDRKCVVERGFSPPEEIARPFAAEFDIPYLPRVLFKTRVTKPQNGLDLDERLVNLHGCMKVFDQSLIEGKNVLVIDDVLTTGSTMNECARALKAAEAKSVYGLVIARHV